MRGAAARAQREEDTPASKKRSAPVPEEVTRRFARVGRHYHFQDGVRAFTDQGTRLTTKSENTEVIKSLVAIADSRGWENIRVTGTERFRKEAWFQAKLAGLEVRGYKPTDIEQERLARALARRQEPPETSAARKGGGSHDETNLSERDASAHQPQPQEGKVRDVLITGRFLDHGKANYQHKPREPVSYFVTLETSRGERTLWGTDLERAIKESLSQPKVGEEVGLRVVGQDEVTVRPRLPGTDRPGDAELTTHRNRWVVETRSFFEARASAAELVRNPKVPARDAVSKHPELASTYLHLKAAEEMAAKRIRDPEDQRKFVSMLRGALADSVEKGEPLQPVRLKTSPDREKAEPERTPDRQPSRTR